MKVEAPDLERWQAIIEGTYDFNIKLHFPIDMVGQGPHKTRNDRKGMRNGERRMENDGSEGYSNINTT